MKTLALETTERIGNIAAFEDGTLLADRMLPTLQRSAQSLAPAMYELLEELGWKAAEIDLVAVTVGPGSFTGLRVGVTTAKTLAYAVDAGVVGVNTLEVIAAQAPENVARLWAVMDAQRRQVFAARFERDGDGYWKTAEATKIVDEEVWLDRLNPDEWISGPVLHRLADKIPSDVSIVDRAFWAPKATMVGSLAERRYQAGNRDDVWQLVPHYFRKSAAEEKREKQG